MDVSEEQEYRRMRTKGRTEATLLLVAPKSRLLREKRTKGFVLGAIYRTGVPATTQSTQFISYRWY